LTSDNQGSTCHRLSHRRLDQSPAEAKNTEERGRTRRRREGSADMALTRSTDPLVWIDCEMTGLDPSKDTILSISCILTNSDLAPLDSGFNAVTYHAQDQLSQMSEWCIKTHGESGLTQQCLTSTTTATVAAEQLLDYITHFIPEPCRALLAGNSIHADRGFLMVPPWNSILEHLHYRLFDVSAMKEMVRRWASDQVLMAAPRKELRHTARDDVLESLQEAQYYRTLIQGLTFAPANLDSLRMIASPQNGINPLVVRPVVPVAGIFAPLPTQPVIPGSMTKQGQEALDMLRNNGTRIGDVGALDQGFRTDVP